MGLIEADEGFATVPTNIRPNVFTQTAFDNGDYGQENNSQHVTNTVLYQYNSYTGSCGNVNTIPCSQLRRRSVSLPPASLGVLNMFQKSELPQSYSNTCFDFGFVQTP